MNKLNIRGKDLQRIGYADDRAISVAKNIMLKYYKHHQKAEALEILKKVHKHPERFLKHPQLSKISEVLVEGHQKQGKISVSLEKSKPYKIYGQESIEKGALDQMNTAMQLPIALQGALMADAHQGYGLPIGGVLATANAVIPYGVGMDIGCRMCMSIYNINTDYIHAHQKRLEDLLIENTRFGRSEFQEPKNHPILERQELNEIAFLKSLKRKAHDQMGTSGHGNHFVDIGILEVKNAVPELGIEPGSYFSILSHSGSRGPGAEIARHYTKIAMDKCDLPKGAKALAWLDLSGQEGIEYWKAMNWAGDYSAANHHWIHEKLSQALKEKPITTLENHHNFAWKEQLPSGETAIIHRKGATPAHKDIIGIIPGSMTAPGFVVRGKGNAEALNSAAHGAGRVMSRSAAKKQFQMHELHELLRKKGVMLIGGGLDESPLAYKDIHEVMRLQEDIVEVLALFKPKIVRME